MAQFSFTEQEKCIVDNKKKEEALNIWVLKYRYKNVKKYLKKIKIQCYESPKLMLLTYSKSKGYDIIQILLLLYVWRRQDWTEPQRNLCKRKILSIFKYWYLL